MFDASAVFFVHFFAIEGFTFEIRSEVVLKVLKSNQCCYRIKLIHFTGVCYLLSIDLMRFKGTRRALRNTRRILDPTNLIPPQDFPLTETVLI